MIEWQAAYNSRSLLEMGIADTRCASSQGLQWCASAATAAGRPRLAGAIAMAAAGELLRTGNLDEAVTMLQVHRFA